MSQQTIVNGNRWSWTSIEIRMAERSFPGGPFKTLNYKASKPSPKVFGTSVKPLGRTRGQLDCTGSFEMYAAEWDSIMEYFTTQVDPINQGVMDFDFNIVVSYVENDGEDVRTDVLYGCRITDISNDNSQGTEPTTMKCELSIMDIDYNGVTAAGTAQGGGLSLGIPVG